MFYKILYILPEGVRKREIISEKDLEPYGIEDYLKYEGFETADGESFKHKDGRIAYYSLDVDGPYWVS